MTDNQRLLAYLREREAEMVSLLIRIVEMESPSGDKAALDGLGQFLADQLRQIGAEVDLAPQARGGPHVVARWGDGPRGTLMLCHMDTVCEVGTLATQPIRMENGRLFGPGALDMKGGIANALWAMRALRELQMAPSRPVTLLITSDEEVGSRTSRPVIEAEALKHDAVFVLEPAQPPHASLKTSRKGVGIYRVAVAGRSAHAGADHEKGINAIEELAHQILAIQRFTDYNAGTTLNVGVAGGGTRSNVVPEKAWARVDVRVTDAFEAARVHRLMQGLRPHLPGTTLQVSGGINRPPMIRTPAIGALYARAQAIAEELGFPLSEAGSGGGSDGNYTAALGIPTLDGMGVIGEGSHAREEHVVIDSLPQRAALLAAMLRQNVPLPVSQMSG